MIDLHTHVLPGIDDGAKNLSESIAMLSDSFNQGVRICAATPHCTLHRENAVERFLERREHAMKKLSPHLTDSMPKLLLGAEVYLDNDINHYSGIEKLFLEGTDYIMLEFPIENANPRWAEWLYNLNRKGIKVLIAHVDRYPQWDKMMADFKGLDVKYQVNASRFAEFITGGILKKLMNQSHGYIISSDMHNMGARRCNMAKAFEKATRKYPEDAKNLFWGNAELLLK